MKFLTIIFATCFFCPTAYSANERLNHQLQDLPSKTVAKFDWEVLVEVEHKEVETIYDTSECYSKIDLIETFPKRYYDFNHWSKNLFLEIGSIKGTKIFEIVHFYNNPESYYIKILAFENQKHLCPFLIIEELNFQMIYSKSYIFQEKIITKMIDNIARQSHTISEFNFKLENGKPKFIGNNN